MARRGRKRAVPVSPMKLKDVHDEDPGEEVERRVAAIQAIGAAEIDSLLSQLRLFRSYLSKEQLESPAKHFFEENLPNLFVIRNEKDKIYELKWRDTERHGDGTKVRDSLDSVAGSHAVSGFHMSVDSGPQTCIFLIMFQTVLSSISCWGRTTLSRLPGQVVASYLLAQHPKLKDYQRMASCSCLFVVLPSECTKKRTYRLYMDRLIPLMKGPLDGRGFSSCRWNVPNTQDFV